MGSDRGGKARHSPFWIFGKQAFLKKKEMHKIVIRKNLTH
jgi:hypothetical protein